MGSSLPFIVVILPLAIVVVVYSLVTGNNVSMTIANKKFSIGGKSEKEEHVKPVVSDEVEGRCTEKELYIEKTKTIIKECQEYVFDIRQNMLLQQMNFSEEKLEELRDKYSDDEFSSKEKDAIAIEAGKLLVQEILYNTQDNTGLLNEVE